MTGEFVCTPDEKDYLSGNWLVTRRRWLWKRLILAYLALSAIYTVMLIVRDLPDYGWSGHFVVWSACTGLLFTSLVAVVVLALTALLLPRRVRQLVRDLRGLAPETRFAFDAQGLSATNAVGTSHFAWTQFQRYHENGRVLVLVVTKQAHFILSKAQMDEATLDALRSELSRNVPG